MKGDAKHCRSDGSIIRQSDGVFLLDYSDYTNREYGKENLKDETDWRRIDKIMKDYYNEIKELK